MPVSGDILHQVLDKLNRNVPPKQLSLARLLLIACGAPLDAVKCVSDLYNDITRNLHLFPGFDAVTVLQYALREAGVDSDQITKLRCKKRSLDACRKTRKLPSLVCCLCDGLTIDNFENIKSLARQRTDTHPDLIKTCEDFFRICLFLRVFDQEDTLVEFKGWLETLQRDDLAKKVEDYIQDMKKASQSGRTSGGRRRNRSSKKNKRWWRPHKSLFPSPKTESQTHSDPERKGLVSGTCPSKNYDGGVPGPAANERDVRVSFRHDPSDDDGGTVQSASSARYQSVQYSILAHKRVKDDSKQSSYWIRHSWWLKALCVVGYIFCLLLLLPVAIFTSAVGFSGHVNKTSQTFLIKPGDVRQFGQTGRLVSGQSIMLDPTWNQNSAYNLKSVHVSSRDFKSLKEERVVPFQEKSFNVSKVGHTRFTVPLFGFDIPLTMGGSIDISISLQSNSITPNNAHLYIFDDQFKVDNFLISNSTQNATYSTPLEIGTKLPHRKHIPLPKEAYYQIGLDVPLDVVVALNYDISVNVMYVNGSKLPHLESCSLSKDKTCTVGVGQYMDTRVLLVYYPESESSKGIVHLLVENTARFDFHSMQIVGIVLFVVLLFIFSFVTGFCCVLRYKLSQSKERLTA